MNFRLTGMLAAAAAVLGALILLWDGDEDTTRARLEQARRAFRFDPARVDRLVIEAGDRTIECRRDGRQWRLTRPLDVRADPMAIDRLLGALQELPRGDILLPPRRADDAYAPYGLDAPQAFLSLVQGTVTNRILIGRRTPLGDGVYVRQSDQAGLARLDPSLLDLLPASADALRDHSLLSGTPAGIDRLDIRGPSGYLQLARGENGGWRLYQPFTARADPAAVATIVEKLLACAVVQFVQDTVSDLAPYGLDSQSAVTAVLNTDAGDGSQMLSLGDPLPNDPTLVYARLQGENSIYAVPLEVRQALLVRPDDLRDRRIPGLDPESIQVLRIESPEATLELRQDADDTWQITAPLRAPGSADAIRDLLRTWNSARLADFAEPAASESAPAWTRTIRIEPRAAQDPAVVLRLAPDPTATNACRIGIEGESSLARATPPVLLETPLDPLLYRSREILSIPASDIELIRLATSNQTVEVARDPATGQWTPAVPWIDRLLNLLAPLRATAILPAGTPAAAANFDHPALTLTLQLRGQSGLATTLIVGAETAPGDACYATVRGRDFLFTLPAWTVEALTPPAETP